MVARFILVVLAVSILYLMLQLITILNHCHRFPYLDPLNHLQLELLRRHRAGSENARVTNGIHLSINGLAAGLRNSG